MQTAILPGYVWHITHRCHQRKFLLKFACDRRRYLHWLPEAKKRYGLCVLGYMVTSNHVHLLVKDTGSNVIAESMQLNTEACSNGSSRSTAGSIDEIWSDFDAYRPVAPTVYYVIDSFPARKSMLWIVSDADHLGGSPRVRDTRIAVALLLEWLAAGMTIDEIVREYPSLTEEAVRGTLKELAQSELLAPRENPSRREHA